MKSGNEDKKRGYEGLSPFNKGLIRYHAGNYIEALECFDQAAKEKPNDNHAWSYKGICLYYLGKIDEAIGSLNRARDLDPMDTKTLYHLALAFFKADRCEEGMSSLTKLLELDEYFVDGWNAKGDALFRSGNYIGAEECYLRVLKINPDDQDVKSKLEALFRLKKF